MNPRDLPKHITIGDKDYCVIFTYYADESLAGLCEDNRKYILISAKEDRSEIYPTFFHEWLHGVEKEYGLRLGHKKIEKLEYALTQLFEQLIAPRKKGRS